MCCLKTFKLQKSEREKTDLQTILQGKLGCQNEKKMMPWNASFETESEIEKPK